MPNLPPRLRVSPPVLFIAAVALIALTVDAASAAPFGMSSSAAPAPVGGFAGWILAQQAVFYRMLSGAIRAAKADGTAAIGLMGISFAYGVFHAAGPGHGKAVIASYLVANNETWKRGIALSFVSAILQAFTAIAIVAIAAVLLGATSKIMGDTVKMVQQDAWDIGKRTGRIDIDIKGAPLKISADMKLIDEGGKGVNVQSWNVSCGIPLVGGKIEAAIAEDIKAKSRRDLAVSRKIILDY